MKKEKRKIDFKDKRGTIMDILVNVPFEHCVIISCAKGAVRGNHFHKYSAQSDFLLSGKMEVYGLKKGSNKVEKSVITKNDVTHWEKGEAHEFVALEESVFLSFVKGPRGGQNYESDTYRLKTPLHEQYKNKTADLSVQ